MLSAAAVRIAFIVNTNIQRKDKTSLKSVAANGRIQAEATGDDLCTSIKAQGLPAGKIISDLIQDEITNTALKLKRKGQKYLSMWINSKNGKKVIYA